MAARKKLEFALAACKALATRAQTRWPQHAVRVDLDLCATITEAKPTVRSRGRVIVASTSEYVVPGQVALCDAIRLVSTHSLHTVLCSMSRLLCWALLLTTAAPGAGAAAVDSSATRWEAARLVSGFLGLDKQREAAAPPRGLQVIGGGFARTGTKSTEAALL